MKTFHEAHGLKSYIYFVAAHSGHDPVVIEETWTLKQLFGVWDAIKIGRQMKLVTVKSFLEGVLGKSKGSSGTRGKITKFRRR